MLSFSKRNFSATCYFHNNEVRMTSRDDFKIINLIKAITDVETPEIH